MALEENQSLTSDPGFEAGIWLFYIFQVVSGFYFVYIRFGYYKRLGEGEMLLIELGPRRLRQLIDEIRAEQEMRIDALN